MDLSRVILGPIITEKAERLKSQRMFTLKVNPQATKVEIKGVLRKYFDCDVTNVRVLRVHSKERHAGKGRLIIKRDPYKKVIITLAPKSKSLDLATFKTS